MLHEKVQCPYCLTENHFQNRKDIYICLNEDCKNEIPIEYSIKFKHIPPCFAQIVGWSSHGKTTFLQSLTAVLLKMGLIWRDTYEHSAQTDETLIYTRNVKKFIATGTMPDNTELRLQDAYIMQLVGMERWGSRALVMRDVAGDFFNKLRFPIEYTPYLISVPSTIMMFSLPDLEDSSFTVDELMNSYIQTLFRYDKEFSTKDRNVVVLLSKADLFMKDLPEKITKYLRSDPFIKLYQSEPSVPNSMGASQMREYMANLSVISDELQDWMDQDPYGHNMIMKASNNDIKLRFSIISSTGNPVPEDNTLRLKMQPTRVVDPFFWILENQSRPG